MGRSRSGGLRGTAPISQTGRGGGGALGRGGDALMGQGVAPRWEPLALHVQPCVDNAMQQHGRWLRGRECGLRLRLGPLHRPLDGLLSDNCRVERSDKHQRPAADDDGEPEGPLRPRAAVDHVGNAPGKRPKVDGDHALRDDAYGGEEGKGAEAYARRAKHHVEDAVWDERGDPQQDDELPALDLDSLVQRIPRGEALLHEAHHAVPEDVPGDKEGADLPDGPRGPNAEEALEEAKHEPRGDDERYRREEEGHADRLGYHEHDHPAGVVVALEPYQEFVHGRLPVGCAQNDHGRQHDPGKDPH
eukprot:CAMPEP_0177587498 /NCGR_PEP_ID=MMETSP0419_2-20121207/5690_1 /TAXON_ID=582737 /ORGANISM="Tetraselmis sp., Strain GSL018" /LENGTH=302 /DNA_ID=CAMNT_0019077565 /DNA_START=165 /DNA_END=1071 /DNA_ORIENTATION=-